MDERILKWLYDIKMAVNEIEGYFDEYPKEFEQFKANLILRRAVERDLEIIGEAVNRIIRANPSFPLNNAKGIIGLRNHIIHSYDNISAENVWAIVMRHIPELKSEVESLINQNS